MSYRELRNFIEIMRCIGYSRIISIESFRNPNFELVADILLWLAERYDPNLDIDDDIETEQKRVTFIIKICELFAAKAKIKLNLKKIYQADGHAVQEVLQIATALYKAYNSTAGQDEDRHGFQLPAKLSNIKAHKVVAKEITDVGAKLFDSLSKEKDLRSHREKALNFLDSISRNLQSNSEQQYIEQCVREIITQQDQSIEEMQKYVQNLEKDQRSLEEKIKKKTLDVERSEKRLKLITNMKPAYMEEYEHLERELENIYQIYIEKFRNLDYLEHELDKYNQLEQKQFQESQDRINRNWQQFQNEEIEILRGEKEIDESMMDAEIARGIESRGQSRGDSRGVGQPPAKGAAAPQGQMPAGQNQRVQSDQDGSIEGAEEDGDDENLDEDDDQDLEGQDEESGSEDNF